MKYNIRPSDIREIINAIESDNFGDIINVTAKIVTDKKPTVAIHGLSVKSALPIEIYEPDVIPSLEVNPSDYLMVKNGYCEPSVMNTNGTFQAVRYGWVVKDRNNPKRLILTTVLKSSK